MLLEALRLVSLSHFDFDGRTREGELVVHADHADAVVSVFEALFAARFPIEQIRLVDEFDGDDDLSMAANNTSGFNCRRATGSEQWSEHAFGRAIDLNPVQNPFVTSSGAVVPPSGAAHSERDARVPGLIIDDGPVVAAFDRIGWAGVAAGPRARTTNTSPPPADDGNESLLTLFACLMWVLPERLRALPSARCGGRGVDRR